MKKSKYDLDDEAFRRKFQKSSQHISTEDKQLFLSWVSETPTSDLHKLKNSPQNTSSYPKSSNIVDPIPPPEKTNHANNIDDQNIFKSWVQNNIPKHFKNKDESIVPKYPKKNSTQDGIPTLDLHGYSRSDALSTCQKFLENLPRGTKKVRIIHGKGLSKGEPSVIRKDVRAWLEHQKHYSHWIADFSYEDARNGGHGATIIWIKRGEHYGK